MKNKIFILLLFVFVVLSTRQIAIAQDDMGDFFDDEFDAPYDDPTFDPNFPSDGMQPPPPPPQRFNNPSIPTAPRGAPAPGFQPPGSMGGFGDNKSFGGSDQIEFRLVDPPKYWQPKKRKIRPPTRTN